MRIKNPAPLGLALALTATTAAIPPAAAAPAAAPAAGAPAAGAGVAAAPPAAERRCFWIRNVNNFRSIDNRTVYIRTSSRDVFELTLFASCLGVDWAHTVALRSRSGSNICEGRMSGLEIRARTRSMGQQRCQVNGVRWLSADEVAALPSRARP
jgi:hypothetical protein